MIEMKLAAGEVDLHLPHITFATLAHFSQYSA